MNKKNKTCAQSPKESFISQNQRRQNQNWTLQPNTVYYNGDIQQPETAPSPIHIHDTLIRPQTLDAFSCKSVDRTYNPFTGVAFDFTTPR